MLPFSYPARVRPYLGYRSADRLVLTARALRMPEPGWKRRGTLSKMSAILSEFASAEVPGMPVTLELAFTRGDPIRVTGVSDRDGLVRFEVAFASRRELPDDPAWEVARLSWVNSLGRQSVNAYVLAPGRSGRLAVISDIDDTIVETGAASLRRNWRRVLAQMPAERTVVPGAVEFYGRLAGGTLGDSVPASRRPFFYVSSSPWNLFEYITAFQKLQKLPQGPLLLRNWALGNVAMDTSSHGSHKTEAIRRLTEFYPELRFALIGDDTQADASAYAEAVRAHPGRIVAVFIRRAPGAGLEQAEQAALASISAAGVPLWTGATFDVAGEFLDALGFTAGGDTERIVATIAAAAEQGEAKPKT